MLVDQGIKLLVVACNTASSVALPGLALAYPDLPVIGVIEPGAKACCACAPNGRIAVIATGSTVRGAAYQTAILRHRPEATIAHPPGPGLRRPGGRRLDRRAGGGGRGQALPGPAHGEFPEGGPDCLVLGCTHFPVLAQAIRRVLPPGVCLVDSAETTAESVAEELARRGLLKPGEGPCRRNRALLRHRRPGTLRQGGRDLPGPAAFACGHHPGGPLAAAHFPPGLDIAPHPRHAPARQPTPQRHGGAFMLRLHGIRHASFEEEGEIAAWAQARGHSLTHTDLWNQEALPPLSSFDFLIVMGGPMNIYEEDKFPWLAEEKRFLKAAVDAGKLVFGVCLGAQHLADVLGGPVTPGPYREIGWHQVQAGPTPQRAPSFPSFPPATRPSTGTATPSPSRPARCGWPKALPARTRGSSPTAAASSGCSSTWRPTPPAWPSFPPTARTS